MPLDSAATQVHDRWGRQGPSPLLPPSVKDAQLLGTAT